MEAQTFFQYCPQCGAHAVSHESNALRCASCHFQYFFNVATATGVCIFNEAGELLLGKRAAEPSKGSWDTFGGFLEPDETAEEGLQREVTEEIGLQLHDIRYLGSFPNRYRYNGVTYRTMDVFFTASGSGSPRLAEHEVSEYRYFPLADVGALPIAFPSVQRAIGLLTRQHR